MRTNVQCDSPSHRYGGPDRTLVGFPEVHNELTVNSSHTSPLITYSYYM